MKQVLFSFFLAVLGFCVTGDAVSKYWLIQEDFIKIGKKELYEEQKKEELAQEGSFFKKKKKTLEVIGVEDLENPRYVFLMPLGGDISSLGLYPSFREKEKNSLMETCLNFQVTSLVQFLEPSSCHFKELFLESFSYLLYLLYDVAPNAQEAFEDHLTQVALKTTSPCLRWGTWKVVLGADTPKYLVCFSVSEKKDLKELHPEELFDEASFKEILRGKKSGWMKREGLLSLSLSKK